VVWWYATTRFNFADAFKYAHEHPAASWAPGVEYAVGMAYYQRDDYPKAQETFAQLLTDFPTGQYEAHALLRLSESAEANRDWQTSKDALNKYQNNATLTKSVRQAVNRAKTALSKTRERHEALVPAVDLHGRVSQLFEGRVGTGYDDARLTKLYEEAETRIKAKKPPGFKDNEKDAPNKYGDVVIWFQLLDLARQSTH